MTGVRPATLHRGHNYTSIPLQSLHCTSGSKHTCMHTLRSEPIHTV